MIGRKRADDWSVQSKLKAFEARHLDITQWIYHPQITQEDAIRALATFCAWVQNDPLETWLHFTSDHQAALALPRDCAMDSSVPVVKVLSYAARLSMLLNCRKSLANSVMKLPATTRTGASKIANRTPLNQHRPSTIPQGFPLDYYQLCSQALEFKELQAAIESSVADELKPLAMRSAEVQALASEVGTLCEEYNALASRLEQEHTLERLKSVNAECETFKANMQNLTRERNIVRENWTRGEEALKRVETDLREQTERIRRCQGLLAKYSERISQSPEELSKKYDNLMRDKAGIYGKDAAQAHARLRCARAVEASLADTHSRIKTLMESLDARSSIVKNLNLEVARRNKLQHQIQELENKRARNQSEFEEKQNDLDKQTDALLTKKAKLEARVDELRTSQASLGKREAFVNSRIEEINRQMSKLREEDMREMRLERQLNSESDEMRKHLVELRDSLPALIDLFDAEIQAHQDKILQDLENVNREAVRQLESLVPADYMKLRALKQGRICGC